MAWGPSADDEVSSALKTSSSMINLPFQKSIFIRSGVLNFLKGLLRVTKDCYRHITGIRCFPYGNL